MLESTLSDKAETKTFASIVTLKKMSVECLEKGKEIITTATSKKQTQSLIRRIWSAVAIGSSFEDPKLMNLGGKSNIPNQTNFSKQFRKFPSRKNKSGK